MQIRNIKQEDLKDVFGWRNNLISRKMFFEEEKISFKEHCKWFENSIKNPNRDLYICQLNDNKLGICRFDYEIKSNTSKISININPDYRGKGYGKEFLNKVIIKYLKKRKCILIAEIKEKNIISKKLFISLGFEIINENNKLIKMELREKLKFKKVELTDSRILYELLKERVHNISHSNLPAYKNHINFVKNNPYLNWYIISIFGRVIGSFYIQDDNSIGINIRNPNKSIINELLNFILKNFSPREEVFSKIPNYFYLNVANTNKELIDIIESSGFNLIQLTFKLSR
tara:strand:+ start:101 stop:961 length:861 start_codon:yes stop_codon:yes gene_type:complete